MLDCWHCYVESRLQLGAADNFLVTKLNRFWLNPGEFLNSNAPVRYHNTVDWEIFKWSLILIIIYGKGCQPQTLNITKRNNIIMIWNIKFAIYQFLLQYFVEQKHLVAFSVIVQAYWRLKVDGSQIILSGDLAPPDECVKIGKSGKWEGTLHCYEWHTVLLSIFARKSFTTVPCTHIHSLTTCAWNNHSFTTTCLI